MNLVTPFLALISTLLIPGCSSSTPSASTGRHVIEERIANESKGLIKLVSFEKTNGQSFEAMGVKGYNMEYKVEIEFVEDCSWGGGGMFSQMQGQFSADPGGPSNALNALLYVGKKQMKKGQHETVTGRLTFEQTEQGWRAGK